MWRRVFGILLRYLYLYKRSLPRAMEVFFWPVMDLLVWGFVTAYLKTVAAPAAVGYLIGSLILWDVLYRAQQALTLSLTEDIWVKNTINLFVAPISVFEFGVAMCLMAVVKGLITVVVLGVLAQLLYAFQLTDVGPALVPFIASLLVFGWALGLATTALILRYGHAAEAFVWGVPFLLQPLSAVFYPLEVLPFWLQWAAVCLPSTHVFEGMRAALAGDGVDAGTLALSLGLNVVWLAGGAALFGAMFHKARAKGFLTRLGME